MTGPFAVDCLIQDMAVALEKDYPPPTDERWAIVATLLPVVLSFGGWCETCHHQIPDHDSYGRCCATVECPCQIEDDE